LGGTRVPLLQKANLFPVIYVGSNIWKNLGWSSIIYLSQLSSIDPQLYEAATIDGAGRFRKMWSITIPGILPTIIILLILRIGRMLSIGFEKIILLYNPLTYETADVISTFVYRKGLMDFAWSYSTAVGQFNSVVNLLLLVLANKISKKVNEISLW
ncbi:MAG TPA: ABC transporter permease subunit, partial [Clostridiales bacterium]|nr:ABC transporter permease subunit [Clostridiales bacterium]